MQWRAMSGTLVREVAQSTLGARAIGWRNALNRPFVSVAIPVCSDRCHSAARLSNATRSADDTSRSRQLALRRHHLACCASAGCPPHSCAPAGRRGSSSAAEAPRAEPEQVRVNPAATARPAGRRRAAYASAPARIDTEVVSQQVMRMEGAAPR